MEQLQIADEKNTFVQLANEQITALRFFHKSF
jgi:hypothetical protein